MAPQVAAAAVQILEEEGAELENASYLGTPYVTGQLAESHELSEVRSSAGVFEISVTVGGDEAPYAVVVHERFRKKFLEKAVRQRRSGIGSRIAKRLGEFLERSAYSLTTRLRAPRRRGRRR